MKKISFLLPSLLLILLFTACNRGPHVIMATNQNGNKTSIEYYGKIAFADDNRSIKSMAMHSQIKFKKNGSEISAERGTAGIIYKVNGDVKVDSLKNDQKQMIADVIQKVHKI